MDRIFSQSANNRNIQTRLNMHGLQKFGETAIILASGCLDAPDLFEVQFDVSCGEFVAYDFRAGKFLNK